MKGFKQIEFKTTFHNRYQDMTDYPEKVLYIKIFVPISLCKDQVDVTMFIEETTKFFVLGYKNYNWLIE